jgi:photosystem I subunit X
VTYLTLLATATTADWSPKVALVMILCNILAIAIGKYTISKPSEPPALPSSELFGGMGFPALLATTSFGHVLGLGTILGLASLGVL